MDCGWKNEIACGGGGFPVGLLLSIFVLSMLIFVTGQSAFCRDCKYSVEGDKVSVKVLMVGVMAMSARSFRVKPDCIEQVKQIFERNGHCTQRDFGEAINLHPDTIRNFLRGGAVRRRTFYEICEALEIDPRDVVSDSGGTETGLAQTGSSVAEAEPGSDEKEGTDTLERMDEQFESSTVEATHPKSKSEIRISQNITHNSGLVIGNVQGDVAP